MSTNSENNAKNSAKNDKKKRRSRRKLWIAGGVGLAVVALVVLAMMPNPVPADFAVVERGGLMVTVDEEGETRVRHRFMVSAPVAGRVLRIELEPGDAVTGGETVVARFEPSNPALLDARVRAESEAAVGVAEAGLGQARAERERAESEVRFARQDLGRYERLAAEEIVSRERLDNAELRVETLEKALRASEYAVRTAEQELKAARARLLEYEAIESLHLGSGKGRTREKAIDLYAPVDGVILRRLRESASVVPAGEPLIEIGDPSRDLEIVSDLLSTDAVKVTAGDRVLIEQWGGEGKLEGEVRRIEPYGFTKISALGVEEQRVNVIVDFTDPREKWTALGDGYRVEINVVVWEGESALKVPTSALFREGEAWAVFVVEAGVARLRLVEIGHRNGLEAEVREGLAEGDVVIVHPGDDVEDGVEVKEREV